MKHYKVIVEESIRWVYYVDAEDEDFARLKVEEGGADPTDKECMEVSYEVELDREYEEDEE